MFWMRWRFSKRANNLKLKKFFTTVNHGKMIRRALCQTSRGIDAKH